MNNSNSNEKTGSRQLKDEVIKDTEMKEVKIRGNTKQREDRYGKFGFLIYLPKHERDIWEKEVDKNDTDRSALIRAYATVGREFLQHYSPVNRGSEPWTTEELIKQNVPINATSAKSIGQIIDTIDRDLKEIVMKTLASDERIEQRGNEFYRSQ